MSQENSGGQKREGKGCGVTDSAYTVTIPLKNILSFIHIIPTNPKSPGYIPLSLCFSLGEWLPLSGCFTIAEYRCP